MAIREGRWDCPSCGSKAVYGRHVDCPGCGKPRPAGIRFYLTHDAPVITDAAQLAEATAGADWICRHCAATNRATLESCGGCGAPRGSSPTQQVIDYATGAVPRSADAPAAGVVADPVAPAAGPPSASSAAPVTSGAQDTASAGAADPGAQPVPASGETDANQPGATVPPAPPPSAPPPGRGRWTSREREGCGCWIILILLVVLPVHGWWKKEQAKEAAWREMYANEDPVTWSQIVQAVYWERVVGIEERSIIEGESFSVPDSAEVIGQRRAIERYDEVQDGWTTEYTRSETRTRTRTVSERVQVGTRTTTCGQRDRGNGYFEDIQCEEPVYETVTRTETYEEPGSGELVAERVPRYRSVPVYGTTYRWRGPQWKPLPPAVARGDTTAPAWPEPVLAPNQRLTGRRERYVVTVTYMGKVEEVEVPAQDLKRYRPGQTVGVLINYRGRWLYPPRVSRECTFWRGGKREQMPDEPGCAMPAPVVDSVGQAQSGTAAPDSAAAR